MNKLRILVVIAMVLAAVPAAGVEPAKVPAADTSGDTATFAYHLRLVRVGGADAEPGAAIGVGADAGTPVVLPSDESWGTEQQLASLRELLGVESAEPVTGFFLQADVRPGDGDGIRFERRIYLGETVADLSFRAVPPGERGRAHRITLELVDVETPQPPLAEAGMLLATDRTVAIAIPGLPGDDWVVLAVTPLAPDEAAGRIERSTSVALAGVDGVGAPRIVSKVQPRYPAGARAAKLTGAVVLQAIIDRDGIPRAPMVLRMTPGAEELAGSAVDAVRQWRYEPALVDGEPVPVWFTIVVRFALE